MHGLKDHLGDEMVTTEQWIPGRMRVRGLPRMIPRFPDRNLLPSNRVKTRRERGKAWDMIFPAVVIKSMFAK